MLPQPLHRTPDPDQNLGHVEVVVPVQALGGLQLPLSHPDAVLAASHVRSASCPVRVPLQTRRNHTRQNDVATYFRQERACVCVISGHGGVSSWTWCLPLVDSA
eukprot:3626023-Rhodomonas_salina.1